MDDLDYDIVRYDYVWTINDQVVRQVTSAAHSDVLARNTVQAGDTIVCTVTPCDAADCGPTASSSGGTINDCNRNGLPDEADIAGGTSQDLNANGVPDECEDCNHNGVLDDFDIAEGTSQDCNTNLLPDECDLDAGTSDDTNANGIPDECEDCNGNGVPDHSENAVILFRNLGQEVGLLDAAAGVAQDIHLGGVGEAYLRRLEVHYRSTGSTPGNMLVRFYAGDLLDHTVPPKAGLIAEYTVGALQPTTYDFGIASFDVVPDMTIPHNLWMEVELDGDAGVVLRAGPTDAGYTHGLVYDGGIQPGDTLLALRLDGVLCPSDCNANQVDDAEETDSDGDLLIDDCDECPADPLLITAEDETPAAGTCRDGLDNDCDGFTDADDSDCQTPPCLCGDLDGSAVVDLNDFATFATCFALTGPLLDCDANEFACSDLNGTGFVDPDDFATFAVTFATVPTTTVPNCLP